MSADLRRASERLERWLFDSALPLWWTQGADHENGGFHEGLALDGLPAAADRRARVQTRQIYVYAVAGLLGWNGPWREAVAHGLDFLFSRYLRDDGQIRTLVSRAGAPLDETAVLYDQAFALFALAAGRAALPDRPHLEAAASRILAVLETRRHPKGGFVEAGSHPFQSNPHMHLLEAALAWSQISDGPSWGRLADEIVDLALARFIDPVGGFLREFFDADWRPCPGDDGRLVEPGHQFEWAWLLARWARLHGDDENALTAAQRLYQSGLRGIDAQRGVAVNALWDDLSVRDLNARLWPQTERLKAALAMRAAGCDPAADVQAVSAIDGLMKYFDVPTPGLWRDKMRADASFVAEYAPASSFYHIICAIQELRAALD